MPRLIGRNLIFHRYARHVMSVFGLMVISHLCSMMNFFIFLSVLFILIAYNLIFLCFPIMIGLDFIVELCQ
ncbi:hypothetical protein D3790_15550 [Xenorhabdus nematophila]|nr:hypothetical protein D3790_15550 [Xenorhabdus nematophila]KHD29117.1 hypothetical protein LH67_05850 [Xenorhabdus nematophila]